MEKVSKISIVILVIINIILMGYIIFDKKYNNTNNENNKDNTSLTTTSTTTTKVTTTTTKKVEIIDPDVVASEEFVYDINNKQINISYIYRLMKEDEVNIVYLEVLVNGKKLKNIKRYIYYDYENSTNLKDKLSLLGKDTINTLKGKDKDYLLFEIEHLNRTSDGGIDPFIVNDIGEVIKELDFDDGTGMVVTDNSSVLFGKGKYSVINNILYYLEPNCSKSNSSKDVFTQFYIELENDKVFIKQMADYEGAGAGGAIC
ncbi:MAG: hypothetical protein IJD92_00485 [Bacilli bacterium]|nr:hypothetical protein [Bacilli bacterium]